MTAWSAVLPDEQSTRALGEALGHACGDGSVLALCGPLGAGKTTLAQGFARGLDVPADVRVRSPTFTVCNELSGRLPLLHLDLYRISSPEEIEDLAAWERVGFEGASVIEWADLFAELLPESTLWLRLDHQGDSRTVILWGLDSPPLDLDWQRSTTPHPGG